jgi:hypothetical protein
MKAFAIKSDCGACAVQYIAASQYGEFARLLPSRFACHFLACLVGCFAMEKAK